MCRQRPFLEIAYNRFLFYASAPSVNGASRLILEFVVVFSSGRSLQFHLRNNMLELTAYRPLTPPVSSSIQGHEFYDKQSRIEPVLADGRYLFVLEGVATSASSELNQIARRTLQKQLRDMQCEYGARCFPKNYNRSYKADSPVPTCSDSAARPGLLTHLAGISILPPAPSPPTTCLVNQPARRKDGNGTAGDAEDKGSA